jgi:hypothetical protein
MDETARTESSRLSEPTVALRASVRRHRSAQRLRWLLRSIRPKRALSLALARTIVSSAAVGIARGPVAQAIIRPPAWERRRFVNLFRSGPCRRLSYLRDSPCGQERVPTGFLQGAPRISRGRQLQGPGHLPGRSPLALRRSASTSDQKERQACCSGVGSLASVFASRTSARPGSFFQY